MALELLLLPRGRAATRHAVGVPAARAVGRDRRGRGRLPGLRLDDDQPRQPLHVDVPFHSDAKVGVVAHVFEEADSARPTRSAPSWGSPSSIARRLVL